MPKSFIVLLLACAASCGKRDIDPPRKQVLVDWASEPALYTKVVDSDWFIVVGNPYTFGRNDASALIVVASGSERRTLLAPAALGIKRGDVITLHKLCYRAREVYKDGRLREAENACTDVVMPYQPPPSPARLFSD